jgi:hypothetical protein
MDESREKSKITRAPSALQMRGTMLWFNAAKDLGALQTDGGERMDVPGTAFSGEKPLGRCAGKLVEFVCIDGAVSDLTFVPDGSLRRARLRHRR